MKGCSVNPEADKDPEVALALAVIQRAVADLRGGCRDRKRKAEKDIRAGLLDYWVEVVASKYDMADAVRKQLRDLVV